MVMSMLLTTVTGEFRSFKLTVVLISFYGISYLLISCAIDRYMQLINFSFYVTCRHVLVYSSGILKAMK